MPTPSPSRTSPYRWPIRVLAVLIIAVLVYRFSGTPPTEGQSGTSTELRRMRIVPPFSLTERSGRTITNHDLAGKIWVADFIYTTCPGPCPMMTRQMRILQDQTAREMSDVRLLSFTVDPAHDTPPVLAEYAGHYRVDTARWSFLTGEQSKLNDVGLAFKLNTVDGSMTHSTRFVLIDRHMRIRGYYLTSEDAFLPKLMHDLRQLEQDKSS